jgi:hypothetical protein
MRLETFCDIAFYKEAFVSNVIQLNIIEGLSIVSSWEGHKLCSSHEAARDALPSQQPFKALG